MDKSEYYCEVCEFHTEKRADWLRHLQTIKHSIRKFTIMHPPISKDTITQEEKQSEEDLPEQESEENSQREDSVVESEDDQEPEKDSIIESEEPKFEYKNILNMLKKLNTNIEQIKSDIFLLKKSLIVHKNNESTIKKYLYEQCKNTHNFQDILQNEKITYPLLKPFLEDKFVDGMTNIIHSILKPLNVKTRPLHCPSIKSRTIFLQHQNSWQKDVLYGGTLENILYAYYKNNIISLIIKYKTENGIQIEPNLQERLINRNSDKLTQVLTNLRDFIQFQIPK